MDLLLPVYHLIFIYLLLYGALILRVACRYVVARLLGTSLWAICIGFGPPYLFRSLGTTKVTLGWLPLVSDTFTQVHTRSGSGWRNALIIITDPVIDFVLLVVALALANPTAEQTQLFPFIAAPLWAFWQAFALVILMNLLPQRPGNVGYNWKIWLNGGLQQEIETFRQNHVTNVRRYDPGFEWRDTPEGGLSTPAGWLALSHASAPFATAAYEQGAEMTLRVMRDYPLAPGERALLLDQLASIPVFHDQPAMLPKALEWSREAVALFPASPTLRGTLASFLVETGQYEEGRSILEPLAQDTTPGTQEADQHTGKPSVPTAALHSSPSAGDRCISSAYLALAAHGQEDAAAAQAWLEKAQAIYDDPTHALTCTDIGGLLSRVRQRIGAVGSAP